MASTSDADGAIDADEVVAVLQANGIEAPSDALRLTALGGGVSSHVVLVEADTIRLVLKRPRARFAVVDEWLVPTTRAQAEAEATRFLTHHLPPYAVAPLVFFDEARNIQAFEAMPATWHPWKARLLAGIVEPHLAHHAGRLLGRLHRLAEHLDDEGQLRHDDLFVAQRIDPYLRTTARRVPGTAAALQGLERSFFSRWDLVHGDFTPKNLLTDGTRPILIDHEVLTRGDAAYDLATLLAHLMLKAIHLPARGHALLAAMDAALQGYQAVHTADAGLHDRTATWAGALLLARVHGKSPVEYLDAGAQARAVALGEALLLQHIGLAGARAALA